MVITLLHPSRSRPMQALAAYRNFVSNAGIEVEYILSLDSTEPHKMAYINNNVNFIVNDNRSAVDAINNAARVSTGDILIVMSDDFHAPSNWGNNIIESTKGKTDWIAKTPDGIQKWIITMPIMDRTYYNRFGYIYHPDYAHMFCDTELTCVADLTGRKITLDIPFVHNHYSTGRSHKDEVSMKADATWSQGESLFLSRAKNKFGLQSPPGKITSVDYINWMRQKGISI